MTSPYAEQLKEKYNYSLCWSCNKILTYTDYDFWEEELEVTHTKIRHAAMSKTGLSNASKKSKAAMSKGKWMKRSTSSLKIWKEETSYHQWLQARMTMVSWTNYFLVAYVFHILQFLLYSQFRKFPFYNLNSKYSLINELCFPLYVLNAHVCIFILSQCIFTRIFLFRQNGGSILPRGVEYTFYFTMGVFITPNTYVLFLLPPSLIDVL